MNEDNRIAFDPSLVKDGEEYNIDFALTEKEKKYFPNLISMDSLVFTLAVEGTSAIMHLLISCSGTVVLSDAHDGKERTLEVMDTVDVTIDPSNDENSDILPDEDGLYDLRGSVLALLFNCIPQNYSEVELTRIDGNGYVLMSEEEYEKEKKKRKSAFSALDDFEFDD